MPEEKHISGAAQHPQHPQPPQHGPPPAPKATLGQVAATLFQGLCMIGAVIAGCVVVGLLVLPARFAAR